MSSSGARRATCGALCLTLACALAPGARASFLVPADEERLLLEAGVPSLALGVTLAPGAQTPQLGLRWEQGSNVLRGELGLTHTTYDLAIFDLRLVASAGPLLVPRAALILGGHAGLSALLDYAWGPLSLYAGPGVDLAASFEGGQRVDSRALLFGASGVGISGSQVGIWLTGQAGYVIGGAGAGGVAGRYGLTLAVPWP